MNRNGMGPENKGNGSGWGRGGCVPEGTAAFPGRAESGMGRGRGRRRGKGHFRNDSFSEIGLLRRIAALEETIKSLKGDQE